MDFGLIWCLLMLYELFDMFGFDFFVVDVVRCVVLMKVHNWKGKKMHTGEEEEKIN